MKLLFVSSQGLHSGSAYTHRLHKLAEGLRQLGVQVDFLYLSDLPFSSPRLLQPLNLPFSRRRLQGYDFIHAGAEAAYTTGLWKRFIDSPIICDVHGDGPSEAWLGWQTTRRSRDFFHIFQACITDRVAMRRGDYYLVVSRPLKDLVHARGVPERNILLVRNGVDTELFRPLDAEPQPDRRFTVCYAGGFQCWQGADVLVEAARRLKRKDISFRFIGFESKEEKDQWRIAMDLGVNAEFVERLPQSELVSELARADLLLLPRQRHPATVVALPTKFSEYAAVGRPVVVCAVDETADMVRERRCGLVSAPTPEGFAEAILEAKGLSPQERCSMGERGRRLAEEVFSWKVICRDYHDFLQEAKPTSGTRRAER